MVMLFTDGLFEVEGPGDTYFSKEDLLKAVAARHTEPAPRLFDELLSEVHGFASGEEFEDDMCLVGMEITRLLRAKSAAAPPS